MPFLRLLKPKTESEPENIVKISEAEDAANNGNISTSESANGTEGISGNCVSDSDSGSGVHDNVLSGDSVRQEGESRAESKPESERESESKSESESESETKPGADSESDSEAEAASESETETESNSETQEAQGDSQSSAQESDSQTDSGTVPEQESESEFNAQGVQEGDSDSEREQESESESRPEEQTVSELPEGSSEHEPEPKLQQYTQDNQDPLTETPETPEPEPESKPENDEFKLQYDFTSGQRYVDLVSTKTEFDKMLDELANISKELLEHEAERFAKKYTGKFKAEDGESESESDARKYEAFLGGYISNAALLLYDKGYQDAALKQLEQAKITLETKKRLEEETAAIHSRVEENNDLVDLSDILGMFGDG